MLIFYSNLGLLQKPEMFMGIIIYCSLMLSMGNSKLLQSPEETEAVVGENVTLRCRTDINGTTNPIEWSYRAVQRPTATTSFKIVYKYKHIIRQFQDRYAVVQNTATGQYDLVIKHVQLGDAGTYTCHDRADKRPAELIVFDKYPSNEFCTITSSSNGNRNNCGLQPVAMSCDLSYRGNQELRLEWLEGESTIPSTAATSINGGITSSVQLHRGQMEASKYTSRVRYNDSKTSRFSWSSTANRSITPTTDTSILSYGGCENQTIECSDGNSPQCKYTWRDENNTEVSRSWSMEMSGKRNGNYTCLATCHVHSTPCSYVAKILNYRCHVDPAKADIRRQSPLLRSQTVKTGLLIEVSEHFSIDQMTSTTSAIRQLTSTTSSPGTIAPPESIKSSSGITSPQIYIPVSIGVAILSCICILLVVLGLRRYLSVSGERTRDNCSIKDAEVESGPRNNNVEMTHFNGTKSQEADAMLTTNITTPQHP